MVAAVMSQAALAPRTALRPAQGRQQRAVGRPARRAMTVRSSAVAVEMAKGEIKDKTAETAINGARLGGGAPPRRPGQARIEANAPGWGHAWGAGGAAPPSTLGNPTSRPPLPATPSPPPLPA